LRERAPAHLFSLALSPSLAHPSPPRPFPRPLQHLTRHSWWNHLNPAVKKGAFSDWEDAVIIKVRDKELSSLGGERASVHATAGRRDDDEGASREEA
jgi:hypothetical protein